MSFGPYLSRIIYSQYKNSSWTTPEHCEQKNISQQPSLFVNHYGQGLFEGIKATKIKVSGGRGNAMKEVVLILGLLLHFHRFNRGLFRLGMPPISKKLFIQAVENFIQDVWDDIPFGENNYLYVRPLGRGTGEINPEMRSPGVFGNKDFDFIIMGSPLHTDPFVRLKIHLEQEYTRTSKGGTGTIKAIGNYGAGLGPEKLAQETGCNQILWLNEDKTIQEFTTATFFMVKGDKLITPSLDCGTILEGITRHHILSIAQKQNSLQVEERPIPLTELIEGLEDGSIEEVFTSGTAITTMGCESIRIGEKTYTLSNKGPASFANFFFQTMGKAYRGELNANWVHSIERTLTTA